MNRPTLNAWSGSLDRAITSLTWIGGAAMTFMVIAIMLGVIMRYLVQQPVLGLNEMIEMTAVVLVMTALPYCTQNNAHVRVDVFDNVLGVWGRYLGDLVYRGFAIFILASLVQRATLKTLDGLKWGDATNMLQMPIWPFYAILAAGAALCVVIFVTQTLILTVERFRK